MSIESRPLPHSSHSPSAGPVPPSSSLSGVDFSLFTRLAGVGVLLFGVTVIYQIATIAWSLLDDSSVVIVPLSDEIERRTSINRFTAAFAQPTLSSIKQIQASTTGQRGQGVNQFTQMPSNQQPVNQKPLEQQSGSTQFADAGIRASSPSSGSGEEGRVEVSYFTAWILTLLLLGLLARIGIALISTGAKLANEHAQRKEVADLLRQLIVEVRSTR